ncbi:MAG: hypothetical protein E6Q37_08275 [Crocinitomicaceae bacterium]|nr:MAG: hypothetical protein E6Q37_08275 [Crocinitomicaceae bacterium]
MIGLIIMAFFLLIIVTFSWIHQKKKGREEYELFKNKLEAYKKSTIFRVQKEEEKRFNFSRIMQEENARIHTSIEILKNCRSSSQELDENLDGVIELLASIEKKLHFFSLQMAPANLINQGLVSVLQDFCGYFKENRKVDIHVEAINYQPQGELIEITMYRIAEEVLKNAIYHGNPNRIDLKLSSSGRSVFLEISDNGLPFNLFKALQNEKYILKGVGLRSIESRMQNGFELQYDHCNGMNQNSFVFKDF